MMSCSCLQLRLSKVSELIHNSSNHHNLESARVSVHFTEIIDTVCRKHTSRAITCSNACACLAKGRLSHLLARWPTQLPTH